MTLVSFYGTGDSPRPEQLQFSDPSKVSGCPFREFNPRSLRSTLGFLSPTPRYLIDTHSLEMEELIRREVRQASFDLVIASQLSMASYHRAFRGIPAMLEEAELATYLPARDGRGVSWTSMRRRLTWMKHRQYVARLLRKFRVCTVASEGERRLVAAAVPDYRSVHVVPNFIDLDEYPSTADARSSDSLVFTGSLQYSPNRDAILWFLQAVYPLIKAQVPRVRLTVTGEPGTLPRPSGPDVEFTGRIADVRPVLAASAVSIVPIRQGGGTRLKILEAMALRTPVVTTSKGVEGLEARDGVHLSVADAPQDFALAVVTVLRRRQYARGLADNAFSLLQTHYESRAVVPRFLRLVELAAAAGADPARETALTAA